MYYYVADMDCYAFLVRVLKKDKYFFLAEIMWYRRDESGLYKDTFLHSSLEEIPYNIFFNHWKCDESTSHIPQ